MAAVLGISKKTLVEIEKGRSSLGWTGAAAFAAIFRESGILQAQFGGDWMIWWRRLPLRRQSRSTRKQWRKGLVERDMEGEGVSDTAECGFGAFSLTG